MKIFLFPYLLLGCNFLFAQSGGLRITVIEKLSRARIPNAKITLYENGKLQGENITDSLGNFEMIITQNDTIDISCEALFYKKSEKKNIPLKKDKILFVDFILEKL